MGEGRQRSSGEITGVDIGCPNCPEPEASTFILWDNPHAVRGQILEDLGDAPYRMSIIERNEDNTPTNEYKSSATLYRDPHCTQNGHCPFESQVKDVATQIRTHIGDAGCRFSEIRMNARNRKGNT